ncbi:MAG: TolC family protein [Spirochaetota bacterium]
MIKAGKQAIVLCCLTMGFFTLSAEDSSNPSFGSDLLKLTLEEAKVLALGNSEELKIIALNLRAASKGYQLDIRNMLPRLEAGFNTSDTVILRSFDTRIKSASASLTQTLFNGGRTIMERKLAGVNLMLQNQEYDKKKEEILDTIFSLFNQILIFKEKMRLQNETYAIAQNQLVISEKEMKLGSIREIDLIETELETRSLAMEIQATRLKLDELLFEFKNALGIEPATAVNPEGRINADYTGLEISTDMEQYFGTALDRNLELKRSRFEIRKNTEKLTIAASSMLPKIEAVVTVTLSGAAYPLQAIGVSVKLNFSFPFKSFPASGSFSAGERGEKEVSRGADFKVGILEDIRFPLDRKTALMNLEASRIKEKELKETLKFQIEKGVNSYRQKRELLELRNEFLALRKRKIEILEKQLDLGEIKRIDLLKAKTELLKERLSLLEDILEMVELERNLERLTGIEPGGFAALADTPDKEIRQ